MLWESCLLFSSTMCLLLPVVSQAILLGFYRGRLNPDQPCSSMHLGTCWHSQLGALSILSCPGLHSSSSNSLVWSPLEVGGSSPPVKVKFDLQGSGQEFLCPPPHFSLPCPHSKSIVWCQPKLQVPGDGLFFQESWRSSPPLLLTGGPTAFRKPKP